MIGHNVLLVAEDGHSVATMLSTYAVRTKGATETDLAAIKRAMEHSPERVPASLRIIVKRLASQALAP